MSPLFSCPSHYFFKSRGTATAFSTAGGSIDGTVSPIMLRKIFVMKNGSDPNYGYKWGVRTWTFINLFLLIIATLLSSERLVPDLTNEKLTDEKSWRRVVRVHISKDLTLRLSRI